MSESLPASESAELRRFAYFMIRLQRPAAGGDTTLVGVVERLGTGEKRGFASAAELYDLLELWSPAAEERAPSEPPTREEI